MSKTQFAQAREAVRQHLEENGIPDHMHYGPVSDRYWGEPCKLVAINMEPYGYQGCGWVDVGRDVLFGWIYDEGGTGTRTARYTFALLSVALAHLSGDEEPTREGFRSAYGSSEGIEDALERTVYYNIRPDSNDNKAQDFRRIAETGDAGLGCLVWDEIRALEADALLVGGRAGLAAVNRLTGMDTWIPFRGSGISPEGFLVQSIPHPSRANYAVWEEVVRALGRQCAGEA